MPVNFLQVKTNLEQYSQKVKRLSDKLAMLEEELWQSYVLNSEKLDFMQALVSSTAKNSKNFYCACPVREALLTAIAPPEIATNYTIIAADGSQIQPSRHKAVQFCVINVGIIKAFMGSGQAPEIQTFSQLLDYEQLFSEDGQLIDEDAVAIMRDFAERSVIQQSITPDPHPILSITDGPLGLYQRATGRNDSRELQAKLLNINHEIAEQGVISAGYIDKPGSDMIGRLFSIIKNDEQGQPEYDSKKRFYKGVSDVAIFRRFLEQPGARSAVFEMINQDDKGQKSSLPVHFFYMNVGQGSPYIVRVEFPEWVSRNPQRVDLLHAVIFKEVKVLDRNPYPYILHRAHELAVIHFEEYEEVERMLLEAYERAEISSGFQSNKEANKMYSGK